MGLRAKVEQDIACEFQEAKQLLDEIQVPEEQKIPLREMMTTLDGRKK